MRTMKRRRKTLAVVVAVVVVLLTIWMEAEVLATAGLMVVEAVVVMTTTMTMSQGQGNKRRTVSIERDEADVIGRCVETSGYPGAMHLAREPQAPPFPQDTRSAHYSPQRLSSDQGCRQA
jgi:hypothetical protein